MVKLFICYFYFVHVHCNVAVRLLSLVLITQTCLEDGKNVFFNINTSTVILDYISELFDQERIKHIRISLQIITLAISQDVGRDLICFS